LNIPVELLECVVKLPASKPSPAMLCPG